MSPAPRLVLIQGPPGTGKTCTLVRLVQAVLETKSKLKVAIATPSNSAADEICSRLMGGEKTLGMSVENLEYEQIN